MPRREQCWANWALVTSTVAMEDHPGVTTAGSYRSVQAVGDEVGAQVAGVASPMGAFYVGLRPNPFPDQAASLLPGP